MNKGFKALPENVQRKIDPEMAKRYEMGGPVMNRPLFQQGVNGLSMTPGFGNSGGTHPVFKSLGMGLNNAITRSVPDFVDDVEEQAKQAFGEQPFQPQSRPPGFGYPLQSLGFGSLMGQTNQSPPSFAEGGPVMEPVASPPMPQQPMPQQPGSMQDIEQQGAFVGMMAAEGMMTQLDDATNPKQMIDAIRGNERPLEQRYTELATYVGEADAQATPESVLAMVQPTIMLTEEGAVDSGVGELMQQMLGSADMAENSAMSQGVGELMMRGAGNTPPANFNQGGAVRHYAPGGQVAKGAAAYMPEFQELYASVLGDQASRDAELAERKKMTQAQMLFDLAQAGLAFAGETEGSSIAERLANATSKSQLFDKLGTRAAGQLEAKQAAEKEKRQMDLAALQSSIAASQSDVSAQQAYDKAVATKTATKTPNPEYKRVVSTDGKDLGVFNINDPKQAQEFEQKLKDNPGSTPFNLGTQPNEDTDQKLITLYPKDGKGNPVDFPINTDADFQAILKEIGPNGNYTKDKTAYELVQADKQAQITESREVDEKVLYSLANPGTSQSFNVKTPEGRKKYNELLTSGNWTADSKAHDLALAAATEQTQYDRNRADELADIKAAIEADIEAEERALKRELSREERAKIEFNRRLVMETNLEIEREQRALRRELNAEEREKAEARALIKVRADQQLALEKEILALKGNFTFREQNGQIVAIDNATGAVKPIFGTPEAPEPEYAQITLPDASGTPVTTIVDINSPSGKQAIALVNQVSKDGGQASMQKISTASVTPRGFLIPDKGVFTSYDGGRTYVDEEGVTQQVPGDAFEVSNTIAYDVARNEKVRLNALQQLAEMDAILIGGMTDADGNPLSSEEMKEVADAFNAARTGTGFWAKVSAGLDSVIGGISGGYFTVGRNKQDARQYIKMLRVMGRSALAASPRFAVADLQTTEQLFPNEQALFANPETEARKLISLSTELSNEKRRILNELGSGKPLDSSQSALFKQKLFEIQRLQNMIGPVTDAFSPSTTDAKNEAAALMQQNVKSRKRN
jgi:hypothetical protein